MPQFVAICWRGGSPPHTAEALKHKLMTRGWVLATAAPRFILLVDDPGLYLKIGGDGGAVVGRLWSRASRPVRQSQLSDDDVLSVRASGGRALIDRFWGGYVGFVVSLDGRGLSVVRDPSGAQPCYVYGFEGLEIFSGDLRGAVELNLVSANLDWGFVAQHMAFGGLRVARTGILGVEEVLPGVVLDLEPERRRRRLIWRPGDFAEASRQITDIREATRLIAEETDRCVQAQAAAYGTIALELSGGLDSSVIAASLAGRRDLVAVNCATVRPEGDERVYARLAAKAAGVSLREVILDDVEMDLLRPSGHPLPRPGRSGAIENIDAAFLKFGQELQVAAFFSGGGGDNVFCYLKSAAPVVDQFRSEGLSPALMATVMNIARLHSTTAWDVLRQAWKIGRRNGGAPPERPKMDFLRPELVASAPEPHPWFEAGGLDLPGRHRHVYSIAWILGLLDGHERSAYAPMIFPLLSQPLMELCLRIPTWLWIQGGRDRSIARDAFAGRVPHAILARRTKGRIDRLIAQAYDRQRSAIGDLLIDGHLARNGVADPDTIARALRRPLDGKNASFMTLLDLADAELWAQSWIGAPA